MTDRIGKHINGMIYRVSRLWKRTFYSRNPKIFIIGFGRTGTTSLMHTFEEMGYLVGDQHRAERLVSAYRKGDFDTIVEYCKTARVFQDTPFSLPNTWKYLEKAYPDARFILTVRDSTEQWFGSLVAYKELKFGGQLPDVDRLKSTVYNWKGWYWDVHVAQHGPDESDIWNPQMWMSLYEKHNQDIIEYFRQKPEKLLVLNLRDSDAFEQFTRFLAVKTSMTGFPHLNRS
jgi:hypothetical protein